MTQKYTAFHQNGLSIESFPYSQDLAKHFFAAIHQQPWAMLLRSAAEGHPNNRFDILVANPIAQLTTHGDITTIVLENESQTRLTSKDDPFTLVNQYLKTLLPAIEPIDDFPFIGGALGYFSYDLGRRVESLPQLSHQDIPTAEMAIGLYEWALIVDHQKQQAHFVGKNIKQHQAWLENQFQNHSDSVSKDSKFRLISDWQSNMSKDSYIEKFNTIQEYLRSGDCYQINLAQRFKAQYQGSEWQAYQALETSNHAPFSAFIRTGEIAVMSISPERFLELNQNSIETKPIKGTRPRSPSLVEDQQLAHELKHAEKDQAENLMIVDLLRNDIGRVANPGSVSVPALFEVESFPAVHHLVSTIRAILDKDQTASDLLRACFPGGSITGAPKVRAMEIIEELEPHRRNVYCGSIGYFSRCGNMDSNITIRTLIAYQQNLYAWAGGGIVADSDAESEYQETLDKVSRILPTLSKLE
ncbi:aminodeoxychorismate synthase, component I [Vibrio rumoiensis 1S-45]|uniref:aminodeoxychorismate synthase n=2 Tax=Vibrio rumoiensis TaxID=76258 RepID=A0A1E5E5N9_9VIBR|nr:aminodeoxychorismate synthase component 1 [Vibrio rumoiensis]OEF29216.1 aminodeoxychorismate synthase, component I [Vibrio rumoiensis 1S-45]